VQTDVVKGSVGLPDNVEKFQKGTTKSKKEKEKEYCPLTRRRKKDLAGTSCSVAAGANPLNSIKIMNPPERSRKTDKCSLWRD
jgi:hypothetical protein